MSKKLILITGWKLGENSYGATTTYLEYFSQFGNVRILMPWEDKVDCDLLVLPGGKDLSPSAYGEVPGYTTGDGDVFKEYFFKEKLKLYVESKTPIFGVCLGFN
jgi:gamma-glutamyl-gamma-aminobutyrate hydrolase PuuD